MDKNYGNAIKLTWSGSSPNKLDGLGILSERFLFRYLITLSARVVPDIIRPDIQNIKTPDIWNPVATGYRDLVVWTRLSGVSFGYPAGYLDSGFLKHWISRA